jgi:hypothetical protein
VTRFLIFSILSSIISLELEAQSQNTLIGASAMAIGNATSCVSDEWSLLNNTAGLASLKSHVAAFSYEAHPDFPVNNRMASTIILPFKYGVSGLGFYRFGDELYSEQVISAAFANKFGLASLGLKANYIQYHAEGFGTTSVLTVSFGGIADLTNSLSVGAHILNLNQPTISDDTNEKVPTILVIGLGYKFSESLFCTSEVEKDLDHEVLVKAGLKYVLNKKIIIRTGLNLNPNAGFGGVSFKTRKFILDYAYQFSITKGSIHQASVSYTLKRHE